MAFTKYTIYVLGLILSRIYVGNKRKAKCKQTAPTRGLSVCYSIITGTSFTLYLVGI